jgi:hypothetical protein
VAHRGDDGVERAAQADDAGWRAARRIPGRETLLQRQDDDIAERRETGDRKQNDRRGGDSPPCPVESRRRQQETKQTEYD